MELLPSGVVVPQGMLRADDGKSARVSSADRLNSITKSRISDRPERSRGPLFCAQRKPGAAAHSLERGCGANAIFLHHCAEFAHMPAINRKRAPTRCTNHDRH